MTTMLHHACHAIKEKLYKLTLITEARLQLLFENPSEGDSPLTGGTNLSDTSLPPISKRSSRLPTLSTMWIPGPA